MSNKNTRAHRIPDADIIQLADSVKNYVERDAAEFATRLVDPNDVAEMMAARNALADTLDDGYYLAMSTTAQGEVDAVRSRATDQVRVIRDMVAIALKNDGRYAAFGFGKMAVMHDVEHQRALRRVHRVGLRFLAEVAPQGLTQALLDALAATDGEMDDALEAYAESVENRLVATAERIRLSNTLYGHINRLCSIGRSLFFSTNEALYNDYLLPS